MLWTISFLDHMVIEIEVQLLEPPNLLPAISGFQPHIIGVGNERQAAYSNVRPSHVMIEFKHMHLIRKQKKRSRFRNFFLFYEFLMTLILKL